MWLVFIEKLHNWIIHNNHNMNPWPEWLHFVDQFLTHQKLVICWDSCDEGDIEDTFGILHKSSLWQGILLRICLKFMNSHIFFGNIPSFNSFWLYLAILISYMEITSKNILKMKVWKHAAAILKLPSLLKICKHHHIKRWKMVKDSLWSQYFFFCLEFSV